MRLKRVWVLALLLFLLFPRPIFAFSAKEAGASAGMFKEAPADILDERVLKLEKYLKSQDSPLASYSYCFVNQADEKGIDWLLLPAIAGTESAFAKRIYPDSFNAYGWGGGYITFSDWPDSITAIAASLQENYYEKGRDDVYKIGSIYAADPNWSYKVNLFRQDIADTLTLAF